MYIIHYIACWFFLFILLQFSHWLQDSAWCPGYLDNFIRAGCDKLELIIDIDNDTLKNKIKIYSKAHRARILSTKEGMKQVMFSTVSKKINIKQKFLYVYSFMINSIITIFCADMF